MSSDDDVIDAHITTLLDDIKLHVGTDMFKRHLEKCPRNKVLAWTDADGLDLMHHAILENNFVVMSIFFALGFFKPPHEVVTSWLYVHMAAVLGQRTIVSALLQERPYDNKRVVLDWDLFSRVVAPKIDVTKAKSAIVPAGEKEKALEFLPVDLAARYAHVQCVKTIIDFHILHSEQQARCGGVSTTRKSSLAKTMGHMNMACILDSPYALRLLLTDNPDADDAKNALDISLKMAKPECVDALLRFGVDAKVVFGGMNLFHVLFAYSKTFEESWFESVVTVTSVLLRHHHNVNACRPSRTFPLYSLLRCTRIGRMETSAPFIMAVLLLLLQAGADPNFDESFVEEALKDKEHHTAFGRRPYPSALHCIIDAALNYMEEVTDAEHVIKYLYKCSEILLRHGADASQVGKYRDAAASPSNEGTERRGNALHALCDAFPYLGRVDSSLLLLLLRHGADPDACVDGRFPLTSYFDALLRRSQNAAAARSELRQNSDHQAAESSHGAGGVSSRSSERHVLTVRGSNATATTSTALATTTTSRNNNNASAHDTDVISDELVTDARRMCRMLGFMSLGAQRACAGMLLSKLTSSSSSAAPQSQPTPSSPRHRTSPGRGTTSDVIAGLIKRAVDEAEKYTMTAPSLRRSCAIVVWRQCRRHVGNVYKLPVPQALINDVMNHL